MAECIPLLPNVFESDVPPILLTPSLAPFGGEGSSAVVWTRGTAVCCMIVLVTANLYCGCCPETEASDVRDLRTALYWHPEGLESVCVLISLPKRNKYNDIAVP